MAMKMGQEAIQYWAKQTAATRMIFKIVLIVVLGGASYWAFIAYEKPSDLIGIGVLWTFVAFNAWRIKQLKDDPLEDRLKRKMKP